jgi:hypothetical protein
MIEFKQPAKRGRPRKYSSRNEQLRQYRHRKKESTRKAALGFPYVGKKGCGDEKETGMMRDEKAIGISSNFVAHLPCHGTLYRDKRSNNPLGYLSGGDSELFIGLLEHLHNRTVR